MGIDDMLESEKVLLPKKKQPSKKTAIVDALAGVILERVYQDPDTKSRLEGIASTIIDKIEELRGHDEAFRAAVIGESTETIGKAIEQAITEAIENWPDF